MRRVGVPIDHEQTAFRAQCGAQLSTVPHAVVQVVPEVDD
jgi:hypothetical protein